MSKDFILAASKVSDGNMSFNWGPADEVVNNRQKFLAKHGLKPEDCVVMAVDHTDAVVVVDANNKPKTESDTVKAEALITKEKGLALFLLTGDCLPIALHDPVKEVIALAHLGWKPTNLRLIVKVIKQLQQQFGSKPENILAFVGPGVKKESYVFKDPIQKTLPGWAPFLTDLLSGETQIDSVGYNKAQMLEAGLLEQNITIDPTDTITSPDHFSHYRSVRTSEPEGRFITVVVLKKN